MAAGPETCVTPAATIPATGSPSFPEALLLLSKPGIVLAESGAGLAGLLLAAPGLSPSASTVCWCLICLIMAASGAAMVNCVLDSEADRKMARLAARSRAMVLAGKVRVMTIALSLMGGAFILAALFLNCLTVLLLATACGSYLFLYTRWLKRRSPWGVFAGAIPGAIPPLIGAAAVTGTVSGLPLMLGIVIFIWQLPHFWFLALQFSDQYALAGIPVLPLTHGADLTKRLTMTSSGVLLPVTLAFSLYGPFSSGSTLAVLLAGAFFLLLCHRFLYRTGEYRKGFIASLAYLTVIFAALIIDAIRALTV